MQHDEGARMEVEYPHRAAAGAPTAGASDIPKRAANLSRARDWHAAGRFDDAAREYEGVLASEPDRPDALHLYGVLQHQRGNTADAKRLMRRAVSLAPAAARCRTSACCSRRTATSTRRSPSSRRRCNWIRPMWRRWCAAATR
ncbi:tetratricopeptide repeat protein [Burkholderia cenocepacia]